MKQTHGTKETALVLRQLYMCGTTRCGEFVDRVCVDFDVDEFTAGVMWDLIDTIVDIGAEEHTGYPDLGL